MPTIMFDRIVAELKPPALYLDGLKNEKNAILPLRLD